MSDSTAAVDANGRESITGRLNTDGLTITRVRANASTHQMLVDEGSTGSDNGGTFAATDANDRPTVFAVSESDGKTLVGLYVNSSGELLIDST